MAEHRATEAALRQAQKLEAVGQLTGGIAHDFNNLLTVVIGNLVLASGRASENSNILPLFQSALRAAERGVGLIQRLLAFARKQRLDPRSVDLGALVAGIEELLQRTVGPAISLEIAADASLAPAHVDVNQVELAILNFLSMRVTRCLPEEHCESRCTTNGRTAVRRWSCPPEIMSSYRSATPEPAWMKRRWRKYSIHSLLRKR